MLANLNSRPFWRFHESASATGATLWPPQSTSTTIAAATIWPFGFPLSSRRLAVRCRELLRMRDGLFPISQKAA